MRGHSITCSPAQPAVCDNKQIGDADSSQRRARLLAIAPLNHIACYAIPEKLKRCYHKQSVAKTIELFLIQDFV